jgi:putative Mg2+ transporter-C (MgtC) family protein
MTSIGSPDELTTFLKVSLAIGVGGLVGLERQLDRKPAGLRTHMLVSLGAAIFIMIGLQLGTLQGKADTASRVLQGIVSGIGFLGGGEIFAKSRTNPDEINIHGLTSAAAIWVSASLGVAVGCGLWFMAICGAVMTVLVLRLVKILEEKLKRYEKD